LRTQHEQKNHWFLSFQEPCRANDFCGRIATLLTSSLTLSSFWSPSLCTKTTFFELLSVTTFRPTSGEGSFFLCIWHSVLLNRLWILS
jgi:hypothetical protein